MVVSAFQAHNPLSILPGGLVTNMLGMPAFQFRDPVAMFILVESDN